MKYEFLIFDADETLFDFSKSERVALKKAMHDLNLDYNEKLHLPIYKRINIKIWKEFEEGLITQDALKVERFKRFIDEIECDSDPYAMADAFMTHLAQASYLLDDAEDLIKKLYKKIPMAIVTNGLTRVQKHRIRESVLAPYFETIIISEEVGCKKPDPSIFEQGLKDTVLPSKDKMLMIGDSLTSDILGGINYGIDTCWFNPKKKVNTHDFKPTHVITDLDELLDIIE
jgi:putative hydrolase of the HAD superfamily